MTGQLATHSGMLLDELCIWYYASIFTALFPKTALEKLGGLDESVTYGEDFDFAVRLALEFPFHYVPKFVYRTRMHGTNRHRSFTTSRKTQYLETIQRNLGSRPGIAAQWRYRRAMAHWLWRLGVDIQAEGRSREAADYFRRALAFQPTKLSALRGWLASRRTPEGRQ